MLNGGGGIRTHGALADTLVFNIFVEKSQDEIQEIHIYLEERIISSDLINEFGEDFVS